MKELARKKNSIIECPSPSSKTKFCAGICSENHSVGLKEDPLVVRSLDSCLETIKSDPNHLYVQWQFSRRRSHLLLNAKNQPEAHTANKCIAEASLSLRAWAPENLINPHSLHPLRVLRCTSNTKGRSRFQLLVIRNTEMPRFCHKPKPRISHSTSVTMSQRERLARLDLSVRPSAYVCFCALGSCTSDKLLSGARCSTCWKQDPRKTWVWDSRDTWVNVRTWLHYSFRQYPNSCSHRLCLESALFVTVVSVVRVDGRGNTAGPKVVTGINPQCSVWEHQMLVNENDNAWICLWMSV